MTRLSILIACVALSSACRANANSMNARDYFTSPVEVDFVEAVAAGDISKLERLVAHGADVNARGRDGVTPAFWAITHRSKRGLTFLLERGADPNVQYAPDGNSAMSASAMAADSWYLREIVGHGGNVNLLNPINRHSPIFDAIMGLRDENVQILIAAHADLNALDIRGNTPAMVAAGLWRYDWVYQLLIAGADPTIRRPAGTTLLTLVRRVPIAPSNPRYPWKLKVVELLKERGLDVEHGQ